MIQRNLLYFYKLFKLMKLKCFLNIKRSAILTAAGTEKVKEFCRQAPVWKNAKATYQLHISTDYTFKINLFLSIFFLKDREELDINLSSFTRCIIVRIFFWKK